jgi:bifunctional DNA-binding transcriptional regulator/antitoxin component of YhaV-PrlF toxin-antitoxin module
LYSYSIPRGNTYAMTRMTSKGQITVPVAIRYALGLGPGAVLVFGLEDGHGVFRRATALDDLGRAFPGQARAKAHALERLLVEGDPAFAEEVASTRLAGHRLRLPDAVLLDIAGALVAGGAPAEAVAAALRDVLADGAVRVDHPAAVRSAIDELAGGGDPVHAYALARG